MPQRMWNQLQGIYERAITVWHRRKLHASAAVRDKDHLSYLDAQLVRTLSKRQAGLQNRCKEFIDEIAARVDLVNCRVLCIGCRNSAELDYFTAKGAKEVVGIDLFSSDPRIKIMDMHAMKFAAGSFDLVFSSHSLEHSSDPGRVAAEILRVAVPGGVVAIEVPVDFQVRGTDMFDFHSLGNLHAMFAPALDKVLWTQEVPISAEVGTAAIRSIFTAVHK